MTSPPPSICQLRQTCPPPGVTCAGLSGTHFLNCDDLVSIIIQSILNLAIPTGASVDDILDYIPTICPNTLVTFDSVSTAVNFAAKRGILFRRIASAGATPTYMINAYMVNRNVQNKSYVRYPCQSDNFFRCSH